MATVKEERDTLCEVEQNHAQLRASIVQIRRLAAKADELIKRYREKSQLRS